MYQRLLLDASFYDLLLRIDEDLAESVRAAGCECGGRLHQGHYQRKPRGGPPELGRRASLRLSFCCSVEGCRRRRMPPSLRFLDRKVFFSVVVLLVPALREGPSAQRVKRLQERFDVSARTLRRWRRWWLEQFAQGPRMARFQGLCATPIERLALPGSLLRAVGVESVPERVLTVLRMLLTGQSVQAP